MNNYRLLAFIIILVISFCATDSSAQYSEEEVYRPQRTKLPVSTILLAHDYTGNGLDDLVGLYQDGSVLHFLPNIGNVEFANPTSVSIALPFGFIYTARGMFKADFTGNGIPEIVIFSRDRILIYEYVNGGFLLYDSFITEVTNILTCRALDFNNDGFLDIVTVSYTDRKFYLNDGQGGFTLVQSASNVGPIFVSSAPIIISGDLNGDGLEEVIVVTSSGFETWENNGDGTFENASVAAFLGTTSNKAFSGVVVDLDNDGWNDVVISQAASTNQCYTYTPTNGKIKYYRNVGDGTLTIADEIQIGRPYEDAHAVDVDGNGLIELVLTFAPKLYYDQWEESESNPCNGIHRGIDIVRWIDGAMDLEPMGSLGNTALNTPLVSMKGTIFANIDGDTLPDLVIPQVCCGDFITLASAVILNKDVFATDPWNDFQLIGESRERMINTFITGKLEEPGVENFYFVEYSSASISVVKRVLDEGEYRDSVVFNRLVNVGTGEDQKVDLFLADLNGDDLDDIVIKYYSSYQAGGLETDLSAPCTIEAFVNEADGFVPIATFEWVYILGRKNLNLVDVNGDGLDDIVWNRVNWLEPNGLIILYSTGSAFSSPVEQEFISSTTEPLFKDVNGDGLVDIIFIQSNFNFPFQDYLTVKLNSGGEFYGPSITLLDVGSAYYNIESFPSAESESIFQLVLRPLAANPFSGNPVNLPTTLYTFNLNGELLEAQELLPSSTPPRAAYFTDLYGTGLLDFVYFRNNAGENEVYVRRALPDGTYGESELLHTAPESDKKFQFTSVFDINNDNKKDLIYQLSKPWSSFPDQPVFVVLYNSEFSQCSDDAPTNLSYTYEENGVMLTWEAPSEAETCHVRAGSSLQGPFSNYFRNGDEKEYVFINGSNLTVGATYGFQVRCSCEGTYSPWSTIFSDVYNPEAGFQFTLYPNPATSDAQVSVVSDIDGYSVRAYDLLGRVVYERFETGFTHQVPAGTLTQGVYLITISGSKGVQTKRLMIQQ